MSGVNKELALRMYEKIYEIRRFEERAMEQYRLGNIKGYLHLSIGQEAVATGTIFPLRTDDFIVSTHRGHGHALAKGHEPDKMFAELLGKSTGYCKGWGGSMHVASTQLNNLGANGIVGGGIALGVGAAMAIKQKKGDQVVLVFFSDGAANQGIWHESMLLAQVYHLPVVFVLENNRWAVSMRAEISNCIENLSEKAAGYCMPGYTLEGNDCIEVYNGMLEPIARARRGEGPSLVECKTYRRGGHHVNDPGLYMPPEELEYFKTKKDTIENMRIHCLELGATEADLEALRNKVEKVMDDGVDFAINSPAMSVEEFMAILPVQ